MGFLNELSRDELADLLRAYDCYISTATDAGLLTTGWEPVCLEEFYGSEYRNVWDSEKGAESFYYMYDAVEKMVSVETQEIPVPKEFYLNSVKFLCQDEQFLCQFFGEKTVRPIRDRIQDIEAGDAFLAGNGVYYAKEASHQNLDEPDEPWIVYDARGDCWFEEDIVPAKEGIQAMLLEAQQNGFGRQSLEDMINSAKSKAVSSANPTPEFQSPQR